jgi:hypothetical protein
VGEFGGGNYLEISWPSFAVNCTLCFATVQSFAFSTEI